MKKLLASIVCAALTLCALFGFTACGGNDKAVSVYMPDGAPALAMAKLMSENSGFGRDVNYNVVEASTINARVTGENPAADICILPVTAASKLLGSGETYKMLATVTHGNLYVLTVNGEEITSANVQIFKGKKVGIVNIASFPGQMFRLIASLRSLEVNELSSVNAEISESKVNIIGVNAQQVGGATNPCDYYIVPEQAASAKVKATQNTPNPVRICGSLQNLYGESGYPQAVLVAKNSIVSDSAFIESFTSAMAENVGWLAAETTAIETITSAISAHLPQGMAATFNTANLTKEVISRCGVRFVPSAQCMAEVKAFLSQMKSAVTGAAEEVTDAFFYV